MSDAGDDDFASADDDISEAPPLPSDDEETEDLEDTPPEINEESISNDTKNGSVDPILKMSNKPRIIKVVDPDKRITDNRLHKSEAAYIIAMRSQQIASFSTHFTDSTGLHDPVDIAYKELYDKKCPLKLQRIISNEANGDLLVEEWPVREMVLPLLDMLKK